MSDSTPPKPRLLNHNELVHFILPDGRTLSLWCHHCDNCTSVDVWTTRGNDVEEVSKDTGDPRRAPMGLFGWRNGGRFVLDENDTPPIEGSHNWPAVCSITAVWHDEHPPEIRYRVRCEDGLIRHQGSFETFREASRWAWWGHACTTEHTYEKVEVPS